MRRVRSMLASERGMSLPELLVAMTLMIIVMSATLTTLDSSGQTRRLNDLRNDQAETARRTIDTIVRQLRNLASPSNATPNAIDRALDNDFAFRTFDPNKKLVRYCLSDDPTLPNRLYVMIISGSATPNYTSCRKTTTGWDSIKVVAQDVVNGQTGRAIFTYNNSTSNTPTITNVGVALNIDVNAITKNPAMARISSGAALRNQNQAPTARFSYTHQVNTRRFVLNGTASSDPEDRTLIFRWYAGQTATFTIDAAHQIGVGAILDYTFPTTTTNGSQTNWYFKLVVSDSNLTDMCPTSTGAATNCAAGPFSPFN